MKMVMLVNTDIPQIAASLVILLPENGIEAQLRLGQNTAGIFGQTYHQTEVMVPEKI